jgi:hypothetical protein
VIIETVVSTLDVAGEPNFAAMGVVWADETITIRPFTSTRTYRNLVAAGEAVVHVTDDVLVFARSALSRARFPSVPALHVRGAVLQDACRWREVVVKEITPPAGPGRAEVITRVVGGGEGRPFAGLCRAKHAVVEASIVASRMRLLGREAVLRELERLEVLVEKTGGPQEREAMAFVRDHVARR